MASRRRLAIAAEIRRAETALELLTEDSMTASKSSQERDLMARQLARAEKHLDDLIAELVSVDRPPQKR